MLHAFLEIGCKTSLMAKRLLIGVGNIMRGDDGVGPYIVQQLQQQYADDNVTLLSHHGEGASLMAAWEGFDEVCLVDAIAKGDNAGRLVVLDALETKIPSDFFHYSTHAFSVAEAVEMARALSDLPNFFRIVGIEAEHYGPGEGLSIAVQKAADELLREWPGGFFAL